jgi:hypothetical protein
MMAWARRLAWRYPQWWTMVLCMAAWATITIRSAQVGHQHGFALLDWTLMVGAMMVPLVLDHVRLTAARSIWRRRHRAIAAFLAGYVAISLLAGAIVDVLLDVGNVGGSAGSLPMAAAAYALAAAWQLSPFRRRVLVSCQGTMPLAPQGWRANRDCLFYGWRVGYRCVMSCAGLMVACVLAGHGLIAITVTTLLARAERRGRVSQLTIVAALAVMSAIRLAAP